MRRLLRHAAKSFNQGIRRFGFRIVRTSRATRDYKEGLEHLKTFGFYPDVVIDAGVLTGTPDLYSAFPRSRFILFEPQTEYESCIKSLAQKYNMTYHLVALGPTSGTVKFFAKMNDPGASTAFAEAEANSAMTERTVPMRRMDEILSTQDLGNSCLLKIDVEGFEISVLEGAIGILKHVDVVVLEVRFIRYHSQQPILHEVASWMADHEFLVHDLLDGGYRPQDGALDIIDVIFVNKQFASRVATTWAE